MQCTLCNSDIHKSGNVRPNVATFECGHEYHLSCVISYCKSRYTNKCPSCAAVKSKTSINVSEDRLHAIESLIQARRNFKEKEVPKTKSSTFSWFGGESSLTQHIKAGTSLNTLRVKGYTPDDFIEEQVKWKELTDVYTIDALLDFGYKWHHMIVMGFTPDDFKTFSWQQLYDTLAVRAPDMMKTSIDCRQLANLKFSIQQIKQLGFTWKDLTSINGNVKTLRLLTNNLSDMKTYFNPSQTEWEAAGFTRDRISLYKWSTDDFTPVRQKREITIKSIKSLDF